MPGVCRGGLGEAAQAGKGCGLVSFPPAEAEGLGRLSKESRGVGKAWEENLIQSDSTV